MEGFEEQLVLIVEDDSLVALAVEELGGLAGYAQLLTRTGDEAISTLKNTMRFCAVLTDIRTPGQSSGWDSHGSLAKCHLQFG